MSDLGTIVNDHLRELEIAKEHDAIRSELTGVESRLLSHIAMYQILENIRKERGFKKDTAKHERQIDKLRAKQRKLKKELFLFRLKHGMKHD